MPHFRGGNDEIKATFFAFLLLIYASLKNKQFNGYYYAPLLLCLP
jgi:hypothetical protein